MRCSPIAKQSLLLPSQQTLLLPTVLEDLLAGQQTHVLPMVSKDPPAAEWFPLALPCQSKREPIQRGNSSKGEPIKRGTNRMSIDLIVLKEMSREYKNNRKGEPIIPIFKSVNGALKRLLAIDCGRLCIVSIKGGTNRRGNQSKGGTDQKGNQSNVLTLAQVLAWIRILYLWCATNATSTSFHCAP